MERSPFIDRELSHEIAKKRPSIRSGASKGAPAVFLVIAILILSSAAMMLPRSQGNPQEEGPTADTLYYQDSGQISIGPLVSVGGMTNAAYDLECGDLDNDGRIDAVTSSDGIQLWENDALPWVSGWGSVALGPTSDDYQCVAMADLDNDGWLDVISGGGGGGGASSVTIWRNPHDPFSLSWTSVVIGTHSYSGFETVKKVAAADIDRDGWCDIISVNDGSYNNTRVWRNDHTPFNWTWNTTQNMTAGDSITFVELADLDHNGTLDIITADYNNGTICALRNDGTPWGDRMDCYEIADLGGGLAIANDLDVGDLDSDGWCDIVCSVGNGDLDVFENDGTPWGAWTGIDIGAAPFTQPEAVHLDDLDNDGYIDITYVAYGMMGRDLICRENDHTPWGAWNANATVATGMFVDLVEIESADVDNDGDADLLVLDSTPSLQACENILTHRNMPLRVATGYVSNTGYYLNWAIDSADLDGDGDPDLLSAYGSTVLVWENDGTPFTGAWSNNTVGTLAEEVNRIKTADLDGDGDLDIVVCTDCGSEDFELVAFQNDGTPFSGPWSQADIWSIGNPLFCLLGSPFALGDCDNDGDIDLFAVWDINGVIEGVGLFSIVNDGTPFDGPWMWSEGVCPDEGSPIDKSWCEVEDIEVGDLDNDGWLDIVLLGVQNVTNEEKIWAWEYDSIYKCYLENFICNGFGTYTEFDVELADMDCDGDLDLVATSGMMPSQLMMFRNNGTPFGGGDWESEVLGNMQYGAASLKAADFDNDGEPEVVCDENGDIVIWDNNLTSPGRPWSVSGRYSYDNPLECKAVGDFDRDGDLDIAVTCETDFTSVDLTTFENIGAQATESSVVTAPASITFGSCDDLFRINVTHNGKNLDADIDLTQWGFYLYKTGGLPMTPAELNDTFTDFRVCLDDGDDVFEEGSDLWTHTTTSYRNEEVILTFEEDSSDARICNGSSNNRTYFFVVNVSATASMVSSFKAAFIPGGYSEGDYNRVENSVTDKVVSVLSTPKSETPFVSLIAIPEFQSVLIPIAAVAFISMMLHRRRIRKQIGDN
jgi:hypothetical protein